LVESDFAGFAGRVPPEKRGVVHPTALYFVAPYCLSVTTYNTIAAMMHESTINDYVFAVCQKQTEFPTYLLRTYHYLKFFQVCSFKKLHISSLELTRYYYPIPEHELQKFDSDLISWHPQIRSIQIFDLEMDVSSGVTLETIQKNLQVSLLYL
jgi:hypothetical protein